MSPTRRSDRRPPLEEINRIIENGELVPIAGECLAYCHRKNIAICRPVQSSVISKSRAAPQAAHIEKPS